MSYWDGKEIIMFKTRNDAERPDWLIIDCGCCAGVTWFYGSECGNCNGSGHYFKHKKSGVLAQWPGGPFLGRDKPEAR